MKDLLGSRPCLRVLSRSDRIWGLDFGLWGPGLLPNNTMEHGNPVNMIQPGWPGMGVDQDPRAFSPPASVLRETGVRYEYKSPALSLSLYLSLSIYIFSVYLNAQKRIRMYIHRCKHGCV